MVPYSEELFPSFLKALRVRPGDKGIWWAFRPPSVIDSEEKGRNHYDRAIHECIEDRKRQPYMMLNEKREVVGIISITDIIRETKFGKLVRRFLSDKLVIELNAEILKLDVRITKLDHKLERLVGKLNPHLYLFGKRFTWFGKRLIKCIQLGKSGKFGWVVLNEEHQHQGLASAAIARLEEWGFEGNRFDVLTADIADKNKKSLRCFERRNFKREVDGEPRPGADGELNTMGFYVKKRAA
nr:GNAT family N-acetyltransferase [Shimazuella soli]